MIAIMYDGLELGRFITDADGILRLKLHPNIKKSWLPYIFEIGLNYDMNIIIAAWKKERVFPKNRIGSRRLLKDMGLLAYNIDKIAEITRCSVITDPYWIAYEEGDRYSTHSIRGKLGHNRYTYNSMGLVNEANYIWRK